MSVSVVVFSVTDDDGVIIPFPQEHSVIHRNFYRPTFSAGYNVNDWYVWGLYFTLIVAIVVFLGQTNFNYCSDLTSKRKHVLCV